MLDWVSGGCVGCRCASFPRPTPFGFDVLRASSYRCSLSSSILISFRVSPCHVRFFEKGNASISSSGSGVGVADAKRIMCLPLAWAVVVSVIRLPPPLFFFDAVAHAKCASSSSLYCASRTHRRASSPVLEGVVFALARNALCVQARRRPFEGATWIQNRPNANSAPILRERARIERGSCVDPALIRSQSDADPAPIRHRPNLASTSIKRRSGLVPTPSTSFRQRPNVDRASPNLDRSSVEHRSTSI